MCICLTSLTDDKLRLQSQVNSSSANNSEHSEAAAALTTGTVKVCHDRSATNFDTLDMLQEDLDINCKSSDAKASTTDSFIHPVSLLPLAVSKSILTGDDN